MYAAPTVAPVHIDMHVLVPVSYAGNELREGPPTKQKQHRVRGPGRYTRFTMNESDDSTDDEAQCVRYHEELPRRVPRAVWRPSDH